MRCISCSELVGTRLNAVPGFFELHTVPWDELWGLSLSPYFVGQVEWGYVFVLGHRVLQLGWKPRNSGLTFQAGLHCTPGYTWIFILLSYYFLLQRGVVSHCQLAGMIMAMIDRCQLAVQSGSSASRSILPSVSLMKLVKQKTSREARVQVRIKFAKVAYQNTQSSSGSMDPEFIKTA